MFNSNKIMAIKSLLFFQVLNFKFGLKLGHQGKCQKVITSQRGVVLPILFFVINILWSFNKIIIFSDLLYHISCDSLALFWNVFFCFVNSYLYFLKVSWYCNLFWEALIQWKFRLRLWQTNNPKGIGNIILK